MITPPSGLSVNMESMTRNPTARLSVSWDTVLLSGEWFRLDQSEFDTGAILSQYEYEEGETIVEGLSNVDSRIYEDESEYLISLEGYAELLGENYQYSISDMDAELDNSDNRFTPRENKNKLPNPGFEFNKNDWNEVTSGALEFAIDEEDPHFGLRDLQINNPNNDAGYLFSNAIPIYETDGYNITPIEVNENWTLSFYALGSGLVNLNLLAYGLSASGALDISTGYLSGAASQFNTIETLLIDSYSESNRDNEQPGTFVGWGQSFTGSGITINSTEFYLRVTSGISLTMTARIYAHTGTFGTNGKPTGSPLAESDPVSTEGLAPSASFSLIAFNFTGANKISLAEGTNYFVVLWLSGTSSNLKIGSDKTSPSHLGNNTIYLSGWFNPGESAVYDDLIFYVYGERELSWSRASVTMNVPSGSYYLRANISVSGTFARFDNGQLEKNLEVTEINQDFIGDLILPKRAIRAEIGFNNYNVPKFTGLTNKFIPDIAKDTIQMYAYDMADRLKDILVEDKYFENKRTDELIVELASLAGIGVEQLRLETGTNTVEFAYFQEASVWTYMNQVAEAEGGRIFFDETGKLTFWNRNHYRDNSDICYTFDFDSHIMDLSYEISKTKVKNRVYVKAYPQKKLTNVRIYNDTTIPSISPGDTQEFFCQYNYLQEISVPALNVQLPVIGTDIIANSAEDGSGSNISSDISISSYFIFRESMRINLRNSNAGTAYLTRFRIYGDPIVIARRIEKLEEDTNSQAIYDVQELQIENNFITTDEFAETLATQKLAELKDPRDFIKIEVVGVPYLQLGDMVRVQRSFNGEYENFHIVKNSWSFTEDFVQTLELEKKVIT